MTWIAALVPGRAKRAYRITKEEIARRQSAEFRQMVTAHTRARAALPSERARLKSMVRESWKNPATRARRVSALKAIFRKDSIRAQQSERAKAQWRDPVIRARNILALRVARGLPLGDQK